MDKNPYEDSSAIRVDLGGLYPWTHEIGEHSILEAGIERRPGMGFGGIFGIKDLSLVEFQVLAKLVDQAYRVTKGKDASAPSGEHWNAQYAYLESWVARGVPGIYEFASKDDGERHIRIIPKVGSPGMWTLREGHHRGLALWILGERTVWAIPRLHPSRLN